MQIQLTIIVTQDHIDRGVRRNYDECFINLALREAVTRAYPATYSDCLTDTDQVELDIRLEPDELSSLIADLPPVVQGAIERFDQGERVEPRTFSLMFTD